MRKITTFLAFFIVLYCNAQYYILPIANGNPNNTNKEDKEYPVGGGLPSGWSSILNGGKTNPTWTNTQTIPFSFEFNDSIVTTYKVSSSGVLTFDVGTNKTAPPHNNKSIPDNAIPNNSVCIWGLSGKGSNDEIVTKTFGTAPNRQHWIMFNNYSEPTNFGNHYSYFSIVLEETSNTIFIVDQRNFGTIIPTLTVGIQVNSTEAYQVAPSPNYNPLAGNNASRSDNKHFCFKQGTQLALDGYSKSITINDKLLLSRGPFSLEFELENVGADTIHDVELSYQINGNPAQSLNYTNINLAMFNVVSLPLNLSWTPPAKGNYHILAWIKSVNDTVDFNYSNDTISKSVNVYGLDNERTSLIETFTSSTSPMSMSGNNHIETHLSSNSGLLTSLKYQMNSPGSGDPYYTDECLTRKQYYSIQSVNTISLDGNMKMISQQLTQDSINKKLDNVAFLKINSSFWTAGQKIYISADVDPLKTYSGSNYVLHVAIFEKKTSQNIKTSGETTFHHVMKKMLPNANGTFIGTLTKANTSNFSFIYEFKGNYRLPTNALNPIDHSYEHSVEDFSDLGVLVWVQDNDTKKVLQSQYAGYSIGLNNEVLNDEIFIYPNPAKNILTVTLPKSNTQSFIQMTNAQGQEIYYNNVPSSGELEINTQHMPRGIYYVKTICGETITFKKIILI